MKNLKLIAVLFLMGTANAFAQDTIRVQVPAPVQKQPSQPKFYLNGIIGYTFDESFYGYYGEWKYEAGTHYGGSVEFVLAGASTRYNERTIELSYQGMNSKLVPYFVSGSNKPSNAEMTVSYITLGGNNYFGKSRKIMGYGGLALGAAIFNGSATVDGKSQEASSTKFAMNFKLGGRIMFSDNIGLKLYTQLNTVVGGVGAGFSFGTGGGGAAVSTYSSMTQFGLGGGLTIGLGGTK